MEPVKAEFRGDMTYRIEYADGSVRWVNQQEKPEEYQILYAKYGPRSWPEGSNAANAGGI